MRLLLALALAASACAPLAVGVTFAYEDVAANLSYTGTRKIAVATRDERPYITSGDKEPSFVGLSRGGYYNPFDVKTRSGQPLADEMSRAIERSLVRAGLRHGRAAGGFGRTRVRDPRAGPERGR